MQQLTETRVISSNQFDAHGNLLPEVVLDLFQDAATHHAQQLGIGFEAMLQKNLLWVVTQVKYQVLAAPQPDCQVSVTTWPLPPQRLGFDREYLICDMQGRALIKGTSRWVVIDASERKLASATDVYPLDEYCTTRNFSDRIRRIKDFEPCCSAFRICPDESAIDYNGHVNNAKYAAFVQAALQDFGGMIDIFQIDFLHEVMCRQPLDLFYMHSDHQTTVKGLSEDGTRMFSCAFDVH